MDTSSFTSQAPGRLVPTTGYDQRVRGSIVEPVPVAGFAFVPNALPPAFDWDHFLGRVARPLIEAERNLRRLNGKASRLRNPHLLLAPFWRREARLSSLIEDTVATPEEIVLVGAGYTPDRDDPREVFNYIEALQHGLASTLPLCNRLFREMHGKLLAGVRGERDRPGEFRREQNYIGNKTAGFARARFVPPPVSELDRLLGDFEQFLNRSSDVPHLVAIAIAHYQFECIHPFRDGNGRLGRLIMLLSLCKLGLLTQPFICISGYFERHRDEYKELLLRTSAEGDWEAWTRFVLDGFALEAADANRRVDRLLALRDEFEASVTGRRASSLLIRLVDHLFHSPAISVDNVRKTLGVSPTAARGHLLTLISKGIIEEMDRPGRAKIYLARRILTVTEDEDGEGETTA